MSYNYNPIRTEAIKAAFAPLNGGLFGLAYGTAIRIGYEQIYPALFPKNTAGKTQAPQLPQVMNQLTELYKIFGGMGAHEFGISQGVTNAMKVYENSALSLDTQQTNQAFQIAQMGLGKGFGGGTDAGILGDTLKAFQDWLQSNMNQQNFNVNQNLADLPPSSLGTPDPPDTSNALKNAYLEKIKNYSTQDLTNLLSYVTVTADQKRWVQELLNSPAHQSSEQKTPSPDLSAEALAWNNKRDKLITEFTALIKVRSRNTNKNYYRGLLSSKKKELNAMSNDYRHPNNFIRTQAVLLRQLLQTNAFNIPALI